MRPNPSNLHPLNAAYLEQLLDRFEADPQSVPPEWREFFQHNDGRGGPLNEVHTAAHVPTEPARPASRMGPPSEATLPADAKSAAVLQDRVDQLIRAYRVRGHMIAEIDPLKRPRLPAPELEPEFYGLSEADMDRPVSSRTIAGPDVSTLRDLLSRMRNTYCRCIGVEFMHIDDLNIRHWLQERMEGAENRLELTRDQQYRILAALTKAVVFEESLQKKFVGAKTFSLEGSESLIPLLEMAIERAAADGIREIVIAMAHRGRLNVLANVMGKPAADIFREFEGAVTNGGGDVKYHLGYSADRRTPDGRDMHLSLCFNPSHLEFVNPVALGRMRAKQDRVGDLDRETGLVLLIHGDAAFAGEGVTQETLNLSELAGYSVGGALHVIVNNQIGFTTPPSEGRSSVYATGVAKMLQVPILHVNGENPEAVAQTIHLAMAFRRQFKRDVFIDMYGYRLRGHNEMDEPSFTQPLLYRAIRERKSVRDAYLDHLLELQTITREEADQLAEEFEHSLRDELEEARSDDYKPARPPSAGVWSSYVGGLEPADADIDTGVDKQSLVKFLERTLVVPDGFHRHPRLDRLVEKRARMAAGEEPLDWSAAEALAFATLAADGYRIRLTGQDTARGTFSQRHAVLHDVETGATYTPLQHVAEKQASVEILNSPLSEAAVMGFEYGYSLDCPDGLILWEAQYGDFVNAAQTIIDQFIAAAEQKWQRLSGLVLLLPHGFEGQGPEHSSARMERFLALAANDNIQVAQPSTPAQYFHLLRRQVLRKWRKPLIVMTPKSLLRHAHAISSLDELATGCFQPVIPDKSVNPDNVERLLLCGGKAFYELHSEREKRNRHDVAVIRFEQYYPLRIQKLESALAPYRDGLPAFWVQEEPSNMGAWPFLRARLGARLRDRFPFAGIHRPESASPATGSHAAHVQQQEQLLRAAFGGPAHD